MDPRSAASQVVASFLVWSSRTLRHLSADTGLSFVQLLLIRNLAARGPLRMGAASEDLALADGVMTGVVDRLEERGVVSRMGDPTDRRATLIGLTRSGEQLARRTLEPYEQAVREIFTRMDDEAVEAFTQGMERLARGLSPITEEVAP